MPSPPSSLEPFLARLATALRAREIRFMLVGGQAVLVHGRARLTEDIDITLGVDPQALPALLDLGAALGLVPLPTDVTAFVSETFVLPVRDPASGWRVDFIFSSLDYERIAIARAVEVPMGETTVPFATAEDLVIHKLFAGRARDLEDIRGVLIRQRGRLDGAYLDTWIRAFSEVPGKEALYEQWEALRREHDM